ncbi:MAG TPA: hypothetical protein PLS56_00770 [Candidatus Dojkabacteria bacterium]|nr:hypothetical protein [Candidatus Dojkabacteria bacterium]
MKTKSNETNNVKKLKNSKTTNKKLVVVYTTIGAFLIILGVYGVPVNSSKSNSSITAVQLPLPIDITDDVGDTEGNNAVKRIEKILSAIESCKITEREAEIFSFMEDLIPLESNKALFADLNSALGVSEEEFASIGKTMESIGLNMSLYM